MVLGQKGPRVLGGQAGLGRGNGRGGGKKFKTSPGMHARGVKAAAASATFFSLFYILTPVHTIGERKRDFSYLSKNGHGRIVIFVMRVCHFKRSVMRYSATRDSFRYATLSCEFQADLPDLAFLKYAYIPVTQRRTVQRDAILNCPTGSRDRSCGARSCILRVGLLYVMYEFLELLEV